MLFSMQAYYLTKFGKQEQKQILSSWQMDMNWTPTCCLEVNIVKMHEIETCEIVVCKLTCDQFKGFLTFGLLLTFIFAKLFGFWPCSNLCAVCLHARTAFSSNLYIMIHILYYPRESISLPHCIYKSLKLDIHFPGLTLLLFLLIQCYYGHLWCCAAS